MESHRGSRCVATILLGACVVVGALAFSFWQAVASDSDDESGQPDEAAADAMLVFFGTYTGSDSRGIYSCRFDLESGELSDLRLAAETESPSFLALHPSGRYLYAVNEIQRFEGEESGAVSAFLIDRKGGELTFLNQAASGGGSPCHLVTDRSGKHVLVANYGGGSVAVIQIGENGRLGERTAFDQHTGSSVNERRQEKPHAHSIQLDPANRFAFSADLGTDDVVAYRYDAGLGRLAPATPASVAPGAGPRHFAFRPDGRFAYVINEMHCTVTAFAYDAKSGALEEIQTITTLPSEKKSGYSTAEVQAHPSGKFLYGSNRGHDSIAVFAIDPEKGTLTAVEHEPTQGKTPRNFGIEPGGRYLLAANQGSGSVVVFRIDGASGALEPAGHEIAVPRPVCVRFLAPSRR